MSVVFKTFLGLKLEENRRIVTEHTQWFKYCSQGFFGLFVVGFFYHYYFFVFTTTIRIYDFTTFLDIELYKMLCNVIHICIWCFIIMKSCFLRQCDMTTLNEFNCSEKMKIFLTKQDRRHNQRANLITKYTYIVVHDEFRQRCTFYAQTHTEGESFWGKSRSLILLPFPTTWDYNILYFL